MADNSQISNDSNVFVTTNWKKIVSRYQIPSIPRATWQLVNSIAPYTLLFVAMYYLKDISWFLVFPLAVIASGFMVRIFIIFHDCGHGSFFKSRTANTIWGYITGILTFTPYYHWRWEHAIHHAGSGNLDRRGTGDIWTLTIQEYLESSKVKRFFYRITRNPIILFLIGPTLLFFVWQRIPNSKAPKREALSVLYTNIALLFYCSFMIYILGWQSFLFIQFTIMIIGGAVGVWLFYMQHQFEGVYWERDKNWSYAEAAVRGSSFYKLPKILQWFSGNIGFHHIHHLGPRIPNYRLEKCYKSEPFFQNVKAITLFQSFKSFTYRLWDEQKKKLVGYGYLRKVRKSYQNNTNKSVHSSKSIDKNKDGFLNSDQTTHENKSG